MPILFGNVAQRENKNKKSDRDGILPLVCCTPIVLHPIELDDLYGHKGRGGDDGCAEGLCLDFKFHVEGPIPENITATILLWSNFAPIGGAWSPAVPSREVRRLRGRSRSRLIRSAHQPAILSSNAEGNRSLHVSTLVRASSTLAKILKGLQADGHST